MPDVAKRANVLFDDMRAQARGRLAAKIGMRISLVRLQNAARNVPATAMARPDSHQPT